jgi:hypothetical protein
MDWLPFLFLFCTVPSSTPLVTSPLVWHPTDLEYVRFERSYWLLKSLEINRTALYSIKLAGLAGNGLMWLHGGDALHAMTA